MFPKIEVPQNWLFYNGNPIKMDDLGVSLFLETPISSSSQPSATEAPHAPHLLPDVLLHWSHGRNELEMVRGSTWPWVCSWHRDKNHETEKTNGGTLTNLRMMVEVERFPFNYGECFRCSYWFFGKCKDAFGCYCINCNIPSQTNKKKEWRVDWKPGRS